MMSSTTVSPMRSKFLASGKRSGAMGGPEEEPLRGSVGCFEIGIPLVKRNYEDHEGGGAAQAAV
jgi:hypothetical protein